MRTSSPFVLTVCVCWVDRLSWHAYFVTLGLAVHVLVVHSMWTLLRFGLAICVGVRVSIQTSFGLTVCVLLNGSVCVLQ